MSLEAVRPRLPAITSLRFFAAFHVALFHINEMGAITGPHWFKSFSAIGYVGVSFFFVLSGFILVYTYAGRGINLRDFWQTRFARIYPAYLFSLLLSFPFFYFGALKMHVPFFAFSEQHFALASVLVLLLLQSWIPAAALSWNGGLESFRGSVLLRSIPIRAGEVRQALTRRLVGIDSSVLGGGNGGVGWISVFPARGHAVCG
jgi:peptidoglycan/LPS O-acetylase OafA/YrhL